MKVQRFLKSRKLAPPGCDDFWIEPISCPRAGHARPKATSALTRLSPHGRGAVPAGWNDVFRTHYECGHEASAPLRRGPA